MSTVIELAGKLHIGLAILEASPVLVTPDMTKGKLPGM
jgi:hypothetical protein